MRFIHLFITFHFLFILKLLRILIILTIHPFMLRLPNNLAILLPRLQTRRRLLILLLILLRINQIIILHRILIRRHRIVNDESRLIHIQMVFWTLLKLLTAHLFLFLLLLLLLNCLRVGIRLCLFLRLLLTCLWLLLLLTRPLPILQTLILFSHLLIKSLLIRTQLLILTQQPLFQLIVHLHIILSATLPGCSPLYLLLALHLRIKRFVMVRLPLRISQNLLIIDRGVLFLLIHLIWGCF